MTNDKTNLNPIGESAVPNLIPIGDWEALQQQLGSSQSVCSFTPESALRFLSNVKTVEGLRTFLAAYRNELLIPVELPAVQTAFGFTSRNEGLELIELDKTLETEPAMQPFAEASRFVGKHHLRSLKPLRGHRVVQKYLDAVESGRAHGWNTTVFGLILAVYSFPLRQGLIRYSELTLQGFVASAAEKLKLNESMVTALQVEAVEGIPEAVEKLLGRVSLSLVN